MALSWGGATAAVLGLFWAMGPLKPSIEGRNPGEKTATRTMSSGSSPSAIPSDDEGETSAPPPAAVGGEASDEASSRAEVRAAVEMMVQAVCSGLDRTDKTATDDKAVIGDVAQGAGSEAAAPELVAGNELEDAAAKSAFARASPAKNKSL